MGQKVFTSICGKNFGYFPDPHASPPNSDDEAEGVDKEADKYMPKGHREAVTKQKKKKGFLSKLKAPGGMDETQLADLRGWGPYMRTVDDAEGGSAPHSAIRAQKATISEKMLLQLKTMGTLHTLELLSCHLKDCPPIFDVEGLVVVHLSHNHIRYITVEQTASTHNRLSKLEKFICDWNEIDTIGQNAFSGNLVSSMVAINLAHNKLSDMPRDFMLMQTGKSRLKYLDLSHNKLAELPGSICSCHSLELLYLQHNELRALPEDIGNLKALRKLFASYNKLKEVPKSIGDCSRLEKVRLAANQIRYLPKTFIRLWNKAVCPSYHRLFPANGQGIHCECHAIAVKVCTDCQFGVCAQCEREHRVGSLEELVVDGNPLVQPSITAFEMGGADGLDRAFTLFGEWLQDQAKLASEKLALTNAPTTMRIALEGGLSSAALGDAPPSVRSGILDAKHKGGDSETDATEAAAQAAAEAGDNDEEDGIPEEPGYPYYFGHMEMIGNAYPADEVKKIRDAERSMMRRKRELYIKRQVKLAREAEQKNMLDETVPIPEHLQVFLDQDFDETAYRGPVPFTDTDVYLCLLVFSTKPEVPTCEMLFDKWQDSPEDGASLYEKVMTKTEFITLCQRSPVNMPVSVQEDIYRLLSPADDGVWFAWFIGGWHLHDLEVRDAYIKRLAQAYRMEYYEMTLAMLQGQLKFRAALAADGILGQEHAEDPSPTVRPLAAGLPLLEGERRLPATAASGAAGWRAGRASGASHASRSSSRRVQEAAGGEDETLDPGSDIEVGSTSSLASSAFSRKSDSAPSVFEADVRVQEAEQMLMQMQMDALAASAEGEETPVSYTSGSPRRASIASPFNGVARRRSRRFSRASFRGPKDPRMATFGVFDVRKSLREAYRNMPLEDFTKLVNFLVRGMKLMMYYSDSDGVTYWHADDPSFRYTTGIGRIHPYAKLLLEALGFVCIMETYWVWPGKHLDRRADWSDTVPPDCPGWDTHRLNDMVTLLKACQQALATHGKKFRGHF